MAAKKRHKVNREIAQITELVKRVGDQRQRMIDHAAAIQSARREIAARGQFIPKYPDGVDRIKICF